MIKVTAGKDEPERCNQAFTVAATAVASGVPVSLWLTGEAAWFALPGRADDFSLPHAAPLPDLLASVIALGTVTVCSQCAARRCHPVGVGVRGLHVAYGCGQVNGSRPAHVVGCVQFPGCGHLSGREVRIRGFGYQ